MKIMKHKLIAVLLGGWNSERQVSLSSGEEVYQTLIELGYRAVKIDYSPQIFEQLQEVKPDIIFNALHGKFGEDGHIQAICNILKIPYTHSSLAASSLCMDKILTHKICATIGAKFAEYEILKKGEDKLNKQKLFKIAKPFVIKPINEGSSVGIEVILSNQEFDIDNYDWQFGDEMIVEKYIAGQEIQVAIMDDKALGAVEIKPKNLFYDYECKYKSGMSEYFIPPKISDDKLKTVLELAQKCHKVTGCRGLSRVDFILNSKDGGDNEFYLLEVNTHPGFTKTSLVPKIAKEQGISFAQLVEYLLENAQIL